jgi:hypothetical protein
VADIERRVEHLEGCYDKLQDDMVHMRRDVTDQIDALKQWMGNGFSHRVGEIVASEMARRQREEWERERAERELQLKEKEARDRAYGAKRDRQSRVLVSVLAPVGLALAGAIGALITKAIGG